MKKHAWLLGAALLSACAQQDATSPVAAPVSSPAAVHTPAFPPFGLSLEYIDNTVAPGADFFAFSNGGWTKTAIIPSDRTYAGVNLELDKENEARLKGIVAELAMRPDEQLNGEERKLRDLHAAFMDKAKIDAEGMTPIKTDLAKIASLQTKEDVARAMANVPLSLDGPFGLYIGVDQKNPLAYSVNLYQSGLGMPDRDDYLKTDKDMRTIQVAYKKYLVQMLTFAGVADADKRAAAVYDLEYAMAKVSWPADERRIEEKVYNPTRVSALKKLVPQFPWDAAFDEVGLSSKGSKGERVVIVAEKSAFPKLGAIFAKTPVAVWRDYLTVRCLHSFADYLAEDLDAADFAFYGAALNGQAQQLDRSIRAINLLDETMGEALGKLYAAKYFPPEAKAKARILVDNLLKAYEEDIKTLDWMSPETRTKALEKLHQITPKVGYPDVWRNYFDLDIGDAIVQDIKNARGFEWRRRLIRIDLPVDKAEWGMTPPTNNAEYNPSANTIEFPAGILQPPFFDPYADDAVNYAEIGATIGHEISHGFDDQGSKYDGTGMLRDWWTTEDRKNFDARTTALAKQYDAYSPLPGMHVNGKLTLGENIADLAGLVIAYKAYHISLHGQPAPVLKGLTGDQRFYIAYGQSWREIRSEGRLRQNLLSNPHSPALYRVNGVVRNDDAWYAAFPDMKPGDAYYLPPDKRVHLW